MKLLYILFFSCTFLYSTNCIAQQRTTFSIGIKGGFGVSLPDPQSWIDVSGQSYLLRTHAFYACGVLGQYVLGNTLGVEAGILNTYISYSRKDLTGSDLLHSLGWDPSIIVNSYQLPIQAMYIFRIGINPKIRIKLTAGIAMIWHTDDYLRRQKNPSMISSLLLGVRIQDRLGRYGRLEYGLEYQHSPHGAYTFELNKSNGPGMIHTKYAILSFNLYYFFFNKDH